MPFNGSDISLTSWANEILDAMQPVCNILDSNQKGTLYNDALKQQYQHVENPKLTPSARILQSMTTEEQCFGAMGLNASNKHAEFFKSQAMNTEQAQFFDTLAKESLKKQKDIENSDSLSFDDFLENYFSQH